MTLLALTMAPAVALAAPSADGTENGAEEASLAASDRMERATKALAELDKAVAGVRSSFEAAQRDENTLLANCLGERLGQMKGLLKAGSQAMEALEAAVAENDDAAAAREYAKIRALRKKADEVQQGADECVGESGVGPDYAALPEIEEPTVRLQAIPFARPAAASPVL